MGNGLVFNPEFPVFFPDMGKALSLFFCGDCHIVIVTFQGGKLTDGSDLAGTDR